MVAITVLNGALPSSSLSVVAGAFRLRHDAAASYARARAAGAPAGITTAYRTKAEQKVLLDLYGYPRAEYPGRSQHGEGVALDIPEPARAWFAAHGARHGWVRTVKGEPWHFEYQPARDIEGVAASLAPTTTEDDMTPEQDNLLRHAVAMLGEVPERTAAAVHATPVHRVEGAPSTALDDAVLGTTAALESRALLAALTSAVQALATGQGADPAILTAAAEAGARAALADLVLRAS